ncbi:helix-turn-helix domain-containing protein [Paenibacillus sp. FSL H8-0537]|uniref:helix-turn-helix domain-containing protein n=1 Tax=Paenibacillus sp. FSL H8-0537 TaxID=2921399 RepID=UPI003100F789
MPLRSSKTNQLYLFSYIRKRKFPVHQGAGSYRIGVHVLCFILEGEASLLIDGLLCRIRPFELYLLVPGMIVDIPDRCSTITYYGLFFEPVMLVKEGKKFEGVKSLSLSGAFLPGHIPIRQPQQVLQRLLHMYDRSRGAARADAFSLRLLLEEFISFIITNAPEQREASDERIERSILYMKENYMRKINIDHLAEAAEMTTTAYSRLFRKMKVASPIEYLSQIRMDKAKQILDQEDRRVKEVADYVGFRSEFYFSRMFQRLVGVSPTVYMKRGTMKIAVASSLGFHEHLQSIGIEPACVVDLFQYPGIGEQAYSKQLDEQLSELKRSNCDLIIADHYHLHFKDSFKQIATPFFLDFSVWDWKRNFLKIAELVNREREAEAVLTRLDLSIEDAKQLLHHSMGEERITVMQVSHRAIGIQGKTAHPLNELIYKELALKPGGQVPEEMWRLEIPPEALPVLETEHLFIQKHHVLAGSEEIFNLMTQTAAWQETVAIHEGNVHAIPNWFVMSWTPLGRQQIIKTLIDLLAK